MFSVIVMPACTFFQIGINYQASISLNVSSQNPFNSVIAPLFYALDCANKYHQFLPIQLLTCYLSAVENKIKLPTVRLIKDCLKKMGSICTRHYKFDSVILKSSFS